MESAKFRNEEETYNMKEILSETEDIDITEKLWNTLLCRQFTLHPYKLVQEYFNQP